MTDFLVYDVFTETPFGGNPLAVIPDATNLPEDDLQRIAREFNFSETTFVFPSDQSDCQARVRIFTPMQEIPFAGHPTIGTALALLDLGRVSAEMTLELGIGPIPVSVQEGMATFVTRVPLTTWPDLPIEVVAKSAGLDNDEIKTDQHPPIIASVGLPFAIAELRDKTALDRVVTDVSAFRAFEERWPVETHYDLLLYVREGNRISARMFAPLDGIPEDPATGSAAAALAALLGQIDGRSGSFEIAQGVQMGRPSKILAKVTVEGGVPSSVAISGRAVQIMSGRLTY